MNDNDNTNSESIDTQPIFTNFVNVECPYCGRKERFDNQPAARAWNIGHIQQEHADELPPFENPSDHED